jgi:hypothetical protein
MIVLLKFKALFHISNLFIIVSVIEYNTSRLRFEEALALSHLAARYVQWARTELHHGRTYFNNIIMQSLQGTILQKWACAVLWLGRKQARERQRPDPPGSLSEVDWRCNFPYLDSTCGPTILRDTRYSPIRPNRKKNYASNYFNALERQ